MEDNRKTGQCEAAARSIVEWMNDDARRDFANDGWEHGLAPILTKEWSAEDLRDIRRHMTEILKTHNDLRREMAEILGDVPWMSRNGGK